MDLKNPSVRRNAGKTGGASGLILFDIDRTWQNAKSYCFWFLPCFRRSNQETFRSLDPAYSRWVSTANLRCPACTHGLHDASLLYFVVTLLYSICFSWSFVGLSLAHAHDMCHADEMPGCLLSYPVRSWFLTAWAQDFLLLCNWSSFFLQDLALVVLCVELLCFASGCLAAFSSCRRTSLACFVASWQRRNYFAAALPKGAAPSGCKKFHTDMCIRALGRVHIYTWFHTTW